MSLWPTSEMWAARDQVIEDLSKQLSLAIDEERFEDAASVRDIIKNLNMQIAFGDWSMIEWSHSVNRYVVVPGKYK